jgi:hypothetical protein
MFRLTGQDSSGPRKLTPPWQTPNHSLGSGVPFGF